MSASTPSYTTPGMELKDAKAVIDVLDERLATLIDLGLTLKHIHWNVVGPNFIGVHEMLDPQYARVQEMVDTLAERIATLGGSPSGTPGSVVKRRTWDDYGLDRATTTEHLGALDLVYSGVIRDHRQARSTVEELDPITEDILIGQTGTLEQFHWFVRAHLEDAGGELSTAGAHTEDEAAARAAH